MDKWTEKQIALMRCGGNAALNRFLADRGVAAQGEPAAKYKTAAAELYRLRLDDTAEGRAPIEALPKDAEAKYVSHGVHSCPMVEGCVLQSFRLLLHV